jgi:phage/plasmid-like protein (TIGR03299 family)
MAHMIEQDDNLFVGSNTPAWHGLGTVVQGQLTAADAIKAAGLDWTVSMQEVSSNGLVIPGYKAVTRDDNKKVLSIMGDGYTPFQNSQGFDFADSIVGEGAAKYETAGSLNGNRRIWLLASLPQDIRVAGTDDVSKLFLLFANSHDGSLAQTALLTATRVVCNNTLSAALAGGQTQFKVRHTKNAAVKLQEAARVLGLVGERITAMNERVNALSKAKFSESAMKELAEVLFPANSATGEVSTRALNNRDMIMQAWESAPGATPGTAWGAENAISYFTDHMRSTRTSEGATAQEAKLNSIWFGSAVQMKAQATQFIEARIAA